MSFSHRRTAFVFFTIILCLVLNSAYGQEEHNPRLAYEIGYIQLGEQYLKSGMCDLVPPGNTVRASENLELAEEAFQKAVEVNNACVEAHLNLARLYHLEQEFDKAVAEYEQVIKLAPNDVNVLVDMALIQIEMDQTDAAVRYLEQAKRMARDERTIQHLNRFVRKPWPSEPSEPSGVKQVTSRSAR